MYKIIITSAIIFQSINCLAQLPNTDIWLLDIKSQKDSIILTNPVNIINKKGYDNQPSFSPDGKYILYTSMTDEKQTDIYKYDLKTKKISQFTNTPTSEYSPNVMPDGKNISVVMVEPDSTQRLWKFPVKGGKPDLIMEDVDSIGYYCWINKDSLALIMTTTPSALEVVNVKKQQPKIINTFVSRCIQKYTSKNKAGFLYMFTSKRKDKAWILTYSNYDHTYSVAVDVNGNTISENDPSKLIEPLLPETSEDYCMYSTKTGNPFILYGDQSTIHILKWESKDPERIIDLSSYGINNISRMAISPDGKRIAIVGQPKN